MSLIALNMNGPSRQYARRVCGCAQHIHVYICTSLRTTIYAAYYSCGYFSIYLLCAIQSSHRQLAHGSDSHTKRYTRQATSPGNNCLHALHIWSTAECTRRVAHLFISSNALKTMWVINAAILGDGHTWWRFCTFLALSQSKGCIFWLNDTPTPSPMSTRDSSWPWIDVRRQW